MRCRGSQIKLSDQTRQIKSRGVQKTQQQNWEDAGKPGIKAHGVAVYYNLSGEPVDLNTLGRKKLIVRTQSISRRRQRGRRETHQNITDIIDYKLNT